MFNPNVKRIAKILKIPECHSQRQQSLKMVLQRLRTVFDQDR